MAKVELCRRPNRSSQAEGRTMQAPIAKFVQTLNEVPGKFVRTLAALRDEREKQSA